MARGVAVILAAGLGVLAGAAVYAQSSERIAAPQPAASTPTPPPPADGKYERIRVHAAALAGNLEGDSPERMVSVYLPPGYAKHPTQRYPVLYLLHGFTDSDAHWFGLLGRHFVNVQRAADAAYAHGARELIIVMPDAFTRYQGSMYSNSVTTGNWEAFITDELVRYIDSHYRTLAQRSSRGLAGHSMGGYGTLRLAMKYPAVFSSAYAMSPCCLGPNLNPDVRAVGEAQKVLTEQDVAAAGLLTKALLASAAAWSPNPRNPPRFFDLPAADGKPVPEVIAAWAANAPLEMVHQYVPNLRTFTAIAFDAGDRDQPIADTVRSLDRILSGYAIAHTSEIYQGNHVDHIQERLEREVLPFFGKHLKFD